MGNVRRRVQDGENISLPHENNLGALASPRSVSRMVSLVATPMMVLSGQPHDGVEPSSPRRFLASPMLDQGTPVTFPKQRMTKTFAKPTLNLPASPGRDLGNLKLESLAEASFQRDIDPNDRTKQSFLLRKRFGKQKNDFQKQSDYDKHTETSCGEPAEWTKESHPTCNGFHEQAYNGDTDKYLGHGYFRDAWMIPSKDQDSFVMKRMQLPSDDKDGEHLVNESNMATIQKEATVMEHLTASQNIVDIYGHCGVSLMAESLAHSLPDKIVPVADASEHTEGATEAELDDSDILELALEMTKSIADLHNLSDTVIIHGDIHRDQWLKASPDGHVKLNDFNSAFLLGIDKESGSRCKASRKGNPGSMFPAPEELTEGNGVDEKIDVYNLGNSFYSILTGRAPPDTQRRNIRSKASYFEDSIRDQSPATKKLVEITEKMWHVDPIQRPSIGEVADFLRAAHKDSQSE